MVLAEAMVNWTEFGLLGSVVGALLWLLTHVLGLHREERKEWKESEEKRSDRMERAFEKMTDAITSGKDQR